MPTTSALKAFLESPGRPAGTLSYHEVQGFLFTLAAGPEMVMPSEWMPMIFGDGQREFESAEQASAVMTDLMVQYNAVNEAVLGRRDALPPDCLFRVETMANLEPDSAVSQWARGFIIGHQWLEESWDAYLPREIDEDFGAILMTLSFFASKTLAASLTKEAGQAELAETAETMRRMLPTATIAYADIGRAIHRGLMETGAGASRPPKVGRNDPCPCGSGRKYKKCCGAAQ